MTVQNRVTIGYYHTRDEAVQALVNYNSSPYDIQTNSVTFEDVYELWSKDYFPTLSTMSSVRTVQAPINIVLPSIKCE